MELREVRIKYSIGLKPIFRSGSFIPQLKLEVIHKKLGAEWIKNPVAFIRGEGNSALYNTKFQNENHSYLKSECGHDLPIMTGLRGVGIAYGIGLKPVFRSGSFIPQLKLEVIHKKVGAELE